VSVANIHFQVKVISKITIAKRFKIPEVISMIRKVFHFDKGISVVSCVVKVGNIA